METEFARKTGIGNSILPKIYYLIDTNSSEVILRGLYAGALAGLARPWQLQKWDNTLSSLQNPWTILDDRGSNGAREGISLSTIAW